MLGYNFYAIMPGRLVQFAIMIPIYCVLTCLLYFSPLTAMVVGYMLTSGSTGIRKQCNKTIMRNIHSLIPQKEKVN